METYLIGGGAILEAGERSTITRVTLHAQLSAEESEHRAVLIDFESSSMQELRRLVALGVGMTAERFETTVTARLLEAGVCGVAEVAAILAHEAETDEVHLFARWTAPHNVVTELAARGVRLQSRPLESIDRAAVIAEHRFRVWPGEPRAA
ncbi:MAG: hypothetical protein ABR584_11470 [Candidatus Baltobacteraceae bacterium]